MEARLQFVKTVSQCFAALPYDHPLCHPKDGEYIWTLDRENFVKHVLNGIQRRIDGDKSTLSVSHSLTATRGTGKTLTFIILWLALPFLNPKVVSLKCCKLITTEDTCLSFV
jgi:hypothetical protein